MRRFVLLGPIVALVLVVNIVGFAHVSRTLAQESTPATACVAPELPPATPVPVEDGTEHGPSLPLRLKRKLKTRVR